MSGRDRVRIRALALHDGDFNVTQVILAPMRPLTAGRSYRLETTTPNEAATSLARRKLQWGVEPANPERVAWTDTPIARGGSREFFGCGPAAHLSIEIPATGDARYALVDVRPHGDGSPVRWVYERRPDGRIAIGHGMCAGPVSLEAKTRYTVEVQSVIGASGRVVPAPKAAPLVMEAP